jgi:hypothetical protein
MSKYKVFPTSDTGNLAQTTFKFRYVVKETYLTLTMNMLAA